MVRPLQRSDSDAVQKMMQALWPDEQAPFELEGELFVWEKDGRLGGFIQLAVRPYVDGADSSPCPHIEGWYVDSDLRRQGVGRELMQAAESWCKEHGYTEVTSDTWADNALSIQAHVGIGFEPTEKLQYFRKKLTL